jgi:hypothetical protein
VYGSLWQRVRRTPRWRDKLRVLFKAPGWVPPGLSPEAMGDAGVVQPVFDPPMRSAQRVAAALGFLAMTAVSGLFLWRSEGQDAWRNAAAAVSVAGGLWAVGAMMSGRVRLRAAVACTAAFAVAAVAACGGLVPSAGLHP